MQERLMWMNSLAQRDSLARSWLHSYH